MAVYNDSSLFSKLNWDSSGLKTMSDSLKSILEQGILLEQALVNHKNRILEKKANKANESFMSESSKYSENDRLLDKTVNNMVQNRSNYSITEMDKSETESHTSNSDSVCTNKALDGLVKLVDQKQLMELNSAVSASRVTQFVTASSNALKNSLLSTDDNLIQSGMFTSCADSAMTPDIAEVDLQKSEGTNLSNVDKYTNSLTQDNQNILLPNSVQNRNPPNVLLPFNLMSIKREVDLPLMPSPIVVKDEQKQEDSGSVVPCLQLNISTHPSNNIDIDNVGNTDCDDLNSEAVISVDNIDLTKTAPPNSLYVSCQTKLTEKIISQFFRSRSIEMVQFKRFNSNKFSSGIVLLKNAHDIKRALKLNRKFLINGTSLSIKRYYGPKVRKESKCTKGRKNKKNVTKSKKNANKKKPAKTGPSRNNSPKKQLNVKNKCENDIGKGNVNNTCASQNMQRPLNLPETNTVSSRNVSRQPPNRHQQSYNNQFSNNVDSKYEKFKRQLFQGKSNNGSNNRQNQQLNQRRSTDHHYYNIRNTHNSNHSRHSGPN